LICASRRADLEALLDQVLRLGVGLRGLRHHLDLRDRRLRLHARHQLLRLGLEHPAARLGGLHLAGRVALLDRREGTRRAALLVGVAATVEVGLRERVGLVGAARALGVHQHHVHHVVRRVPARRQRQLEAPRR
jgi:hypothetical protein